MREWGAVGVLFLLFPFNYNYNSRVKILFVAKNNFIAAAMCATIAAVCVFFRAVHLKIIVSVPRLNSIKNFFAVELFVFVYVCAFDMCI